MWSRASWTALSLPDDRHAQARIVGPRGLRPGARLHGDGRPRQRALSGVAPSPTRLTAPGARATFAQMFHCRSGWAGLVRPVTCHPSALEAHHAASHRIAHFSHSPAHRGRGGSSRGVPTGQETGEASVEVEMDGVRAAEDQHSVVKLVGGHGFSDFQAAFDRAFSRQPLQDEHYRVAATGELETAPRRWRAMFGRDSARPQGPSRDGSTLGRTGTWRDVADFGRKLQSRSP